MSETPHTHNLRNGLALVATLGAGAASIAGLNGDGKEQHRVPTSADTLTRVVPHQPPAELLGPVTLAEPPVPLHESRHSHTGHRHHKVKLSIASTPEQTPVRKEHPKPPSHDDPGPVVITPPKGTLPPAPEQLLELHPESLTTPAAEAEVMHDNAVYLPVLGCSGILVRNAGGTPIGIKTAKHCLKDNWYIDASDQYGLNFDGQPVYAELGDSLDDLTIAGQVTQFAFAPLDKASDTAFGAFEGQSMDDVIASATSNQMPAEQVDSLPRGTVVYMGSYPQDELNNPGPSKRENFAMHVIGTTTENVADEGEVLRTLVAAIPESADGAECSWRSSGSEVFTLDASGNRIDIGTQTAFNDFGLLRYKDDPKAGAEERASIEQQFGVDMTGYAGVCYISFLSPSAADGMVTANVYTPPPIPPPTPEQLALEQFEETFAADFVDPTYTRKIINGFVQVNEPNGGSYWLDKPAYAYDPATKTLLLAYYGLKGGGSTALSLETFPDGTMQNVAIYSHDGGITPPDITTTSTGALVPNADGSPSFTDANGFNFGIFLQGDMSQPVAPGSGLVDSLNVDANGNLVLNIPVDKGGGDPNAPPPPTTPTTPTTPETPTEPTTPTTP